MRYTKEELKEFEVIRNDAHRLREEILTIIYPQTNYICFFVEYFPDWNTQSGKNRIRSTWNGATAHKDVVDIMSKILTKLKNK